MYKNVLLPTHSVSFNDRFFIQNIRHPSKDMYFFFWKRLKKSFIFGEQLNYTQVIFFSGGVKIHVKTFLHQVSLHTDIYSKYKRFFTYVF